MFDDHVPFTRTEALLEGITDRQLGGPRFRKVLTGYYLPAAVPYSVLHATRAALMSHPVGAVASHFSVTRLLGAPVSDQGEEHVTVRVRATGDRATACAATWGRWRAATSPRSTTSSSPGPSGPSST